MVHQYAHIDLFSLTRSLSKTAQPTLPDSRQNSRNPRYGWHTHEKAGVVKTIPREIKMENGK
jgi:hypothetical protein